MAQFDVPTFYDTVLANTSVDALTLIAHSQGATQSFAALSSSPDLQSKTIRYIALAPVLFMNRFPQNPNIFTYLSYLRIPELADALGIYALDHVNSGQNPIIHSWIELLCVKTSFICKWVLAISTEKFPESVDFEEMPRFLSINPSGASVKSFKHFIQLIFAKDPKFQKYDYGKEVNLEKYNSEEPPQYDISKIKTKVALFYGEGDNLCTLENIAFINSAKKDCYNYYMDLWGHVDYTWAKDKTKFYERLEKALVL